MASSIFMSLLLVVVLSASTISMICNAQQLSSSKFYDKTCPNALPTIRAAIKTAVSKERRMAASLVRLHFHDCFVQGCDGSILLKDGPTIQTEQTTLRNNNSVRGFDVIDDAKARVEKICPGVVSCADIVAVAARDASAAVGGPSWEVELGRRDSTTASPSLAVTDLPGAADSLDKLLSLFQSKGLNTRDMVALSGAHTIGQARCVTFRTRIYSNTSDIDAGFASTRRRGCPQSGGDSNLAPLDLVTPNSFDNNYFNNLIQKKGLLASDQVLLSGGPTNSIVSEYSKSSTTFAADFAKAMIKMGSIDPLTGSQGEIRKICSVIN